MLVEKCPTQLQNVCTLLRKWRLAAVNLDTVIHDYQAQGWANHQPTHNGQSVARLR